MYKDFEVIKEPKSLPLMIIITFVVAANTILMFSCIILHPLHKKNTITFMGVITWNFVFLHNNALIYFHKLFALHLWKELYEILSFCIIQHPLHKQLGTYGHVLPQGGVQWPYGVDLGDREVCSRLVTRQHTYAVTATHTHKDTHKWNRWWFTACIGFWNVWTSTGDIII